MTLGQLRLLTAFLTGLVVSALVGFLGGSDDLRFVLAGIALFMGVGVVPLVGPGGRELRARLRFRL